ncbi:uncharacterized protein LOC127840053 [Dreissena polymorpha]|uniref:Uncharacterized protein n=1 Tax=Dreissena polymorpha TaxID=45954 RepID=A0A9D4FAG9_DREPO|nr:uncharacterized protein LOC127840053 [Dreissena polymorpha]KAH3792227.1 hypothetical protein DPMN_145718 [Dreissena polymorpha]
MEKNPQQPLVHWLYCLAVVCVVYVGLATAYDLHASPKIKMDMAELGEKGSKSIIDDHFCDDDVTIVKINGVTASHLRKRDARGKLKNETSKVIPSTSEKISFEDLEKIYLINKTMNYLVQIYFSAIYLNDTINNVTSSTDMTSNHSVANTIRTIPLLNRMLQQLNDMPDLNSLRAVLGGVTHSVSSGQVQSADLTSFCCNMAG